MMQLPEIEKKIEQLYTLKKVMTLPGVISFGFRGCRRALALQAMRNVGDLRVAPMISIDKHYRSSLDKPKVRYGLPLRKIIWRY